MGSDSIPDELAALLAESFVIRLGPGEFAITLPKAFKPEKFTAGGAVVNKDGVLTIFGDDGETALRVFARGTWRDIHLVKPIEVSEKPKTPKPDGEKVRTLRVVSGLQ